ncbi:hypothetical protein CR513_13399, partial [Mucuna pruriens]
MADNNKLTPIWEGPFRIIEEVGKGAYRLEHLDGRKIPRTWNALSLRLYHMKKKDLRRMVEKVPSRHEEKKTYEGWRKRSPLGTKKKRPAKDGRRGPLQAQRKKDLRRTVEEVPSRHEEKNTYEGRPKRSPLGTKKNELRRTAKEIPSRHEEKRPAKDGRRGPLQA